MPRRHLVFLAVGAYLLFRLPAVTGLPIFVDESNYLYWADLVRQDPARNAFVSMIDPKPPLHVWLLALVLGLGRDRLACGRLLSVAVGAVTLPVFIALAGRLEKLAFGRAPPPAAGDTSPRARPSEWFAAALFITSPYLAFSQRMALIESLFLLDEVAIAWLSLSVAEAFWESGTDRRRPVILWGLLGVALAATFLTRQNVSYVLVALPILAILLFPRGGRTWDRRATSRLLVKMSGALIVAILLWLPALVSKATPTCPRRT